MTDDKQAILQDNQDMYYSQRKLERPTMITDKKCLNVDISEVPDGDEFYWRGALWRHDGLGAITLVDQREITLRKSFGYLDYYQGEVCTVLPFGETMVKWIVTPDDLLTASQVGLVNA